MFVKPVEGRIVRYPDMDRFLPKGGAEVPDNPYWRKRLRDGDVEKAKPEKAEKKGAVEK